MHAERALTKGEEKSNPNAHRLWRLTQVFTYCFVVNADAWKQFCGELDLNPEAMLRDCLGYVNKLSVADWYQVGGSPESHAYSFVPLPTPPLHER